MCNHTDIKNFEKYKTKTQSDLSFVVKGKNPKYFCKEVGFMKTCKKILSVALAATMLASAVPLVASAYIRGYEEEQIKSGDYSYHLNKDGNAVITRYSGTEAEVSVPDTIDGKKVVTVENAFSGNRTVTAVTLPDTVTELTDAAFDECTELKTVSLTPKLKKIGYLAFGNCKKLEQIELQDGLEEIGMYAFQFSGLTSVTVPDTVKKVGKGAFEYCEKLSDFSVSGDDTLIGEDVLTHTAWYDEMSDGAVYIGNSLYKYKGEAPSVAEVREGTTQLCAGAFYRQDKMTEVVLPDSVSVIGNRAFNYCYALKKVNFPKNLKTIAKYAFQYCESLEIFALPDSLRTMGEGVFSYCDSLTKFTLPKSIKKVSTSLLFSCKKLKTVKLHSGVTAINPDAFAGCQKLKTITIPKKTTVIGSGAFANCTSIQKINLPSGLKAINASTFSNCSSLAQIKLPNGIKTIDDDAFASCEKITKIAIPKSVIKIGRMAFLRLPIKSIELKNPKLLICEDAFYKCSKLKKVTYPKNIYKIEQNAFRGTPWYKALYKKSGNQVYIGKCLCDLKKSVKTLKVKDGTKGVALPYMELGTVILPASVKYFQQDTLAFYKYISSYYWDDESEDDCREEEEIYVTCKKVHCPKGSYAEKYCKKVSCPYDNKMP